MNALRLLTALLGLLLCLSLETALLAAEEIIKDAQGMDCHVYLPDDFDPDKTYQLMVGVHGAGRSNGRGAGGIAGWAKRGDVIVIGPAFETKGERPYQNGDGIHAQKLIKLFRELGEKYKLRDKMFLHGFSGGSQFTHRFTLLHPEYVCGVSAHSGGSWATDGFGTVTSKARKIPFAVSCGEKDTGKSWGSAKYGRLDWFKHFVKELETNKLTYIADTWPDVGHRPSPGVQKLLKECFQLATGLPGQSATESVEISNQWVNLDMLPDAKPLGQHSPNKPYADPHKLRKAAQAAFAIADKQTVADEKLVYFMEQYPPLLWREMDGSTRLLEQCRAAAARWKKKAEDLGSFDGEVKRRYERFSQGLAGGGS